MTRLGRFWTAAAVAVLGATTLLIGAHANWAQLSGCVGDCNEDGEVTIDDIIIMVNIAQGTGNLDDCLNGDADGSGEITVDEIVQAVAHAQNDCPEMPTPTPTVTPGGALGVKHFVLDANNSKFRTAIAPGLVIPIGGFRGQTDGQTVTPYFDIEAGEPNAAGLATVNIIGAPEYIFVNGSAFAPIVLCLKPILPVMNAGALDCDGTLDFSILTSIDHNLGQVGVDDFAPADCEALGGSIEGENQVCAAGEIGDECFENADCDSAPAAGDGRCGLTDAVCTAGKEGEACRNDSDCASQPGGDDGVCGEAAPHPGVCNGSTMFGQAEETNRPGELVIAPLPQLGLNGLPVELNIEQDEPCGDEGPGQSLSFAMTTARSRTTVFNFNNTEDDFPFCQRGQNMSCSDWQNAPGGLVLSFGALHQFNSSDVITGFQFGTAGSTSGPEMCPQ